MYLLMFLVASVPAFPDDEPHLRMHIWHETKRHTQRQINDVQCVRACMHACACGTDEGNNTMQSRRGRSYPIINCVYPREEKSPRNKNRGGCGRCESKPRKEDIHEMDVVRC